VGDRRYAVPPDVERLLVDDAAFATLAAPLRRDLETELARGDMADIEAQKSHLFTLALLDSLDGDWPGAVARLDQIATMERDPATRAMRGLTIRVWARAHAAGGDATAAFRASFEAELALLPRDLVADDLAQMLAIAQTFSVEWCQAAIRDHVGPTAASGSIPLDLAATVVFQRYAVLRIVPVAPTIIAVLSQP
jgi:hypothetical protein